MTDTDSGPKAPPPRRASYTLHVASVAGHDREGFESFPAAQLRLVRLLDEVLDLFDTEPRFQHFTLDGSAILLEDYLSIRPEHFERVEKAVQEGRLLVGPWYIQTDPLLVSAESLIRNLLIGLRTARVFGPPMLVGYLTDVLGAPAYLPQILKGFGIEVLVVSQPRPYQEIPLPAEFAWHGDDGSEILAGNMLELGPRMQIEAARERLAPTCESGHLLLSYPVYPVYPGIGTTEVLDSMSLARSQLHDDLFHSSPAAFSRALLSYAKSSPLPTVNGALGGGSSAHIELLSNIRRSRETERLLAEEIDPLLAWAENTPAVRDSPLVRRPHRRPQTIRQRLWRLLLENQFSNAPMTGPDRLGTVSVEVDYRYQHIEKTANALVNYTMPWMQQEIGWEYHEPYSLLPRLVRPSEPGFQVLTAKLPEEPERSGMIVRGQNTTAESLYVTLTPWRAFSTVEVVTLDEVPTGGQLAPDPDQNGAITFRAAPYRILTFWFHD